MPDDQVVAGLPDAAREPAAPGPKRGGAPSRPRRRSDGAWALWVEGAVVVGLTGVGLLAPVGPRAFYRALFTGFAWIAGVVISGAAIVTWVAERRADRLQGPRRKPALMLRGARDTALAGWIMACLLAWPLSRLQTGAPVGLTWSLAEAGGPARTILQTVAGVLVIDAWLYWKHRLLHTRWLFHFHRAHHVYRDPTAFAGFAVGPVESLLTFWPVVIWAHPAAVHWAPLYLGLVGGFVWLNYYLHCGVTYRLLEAVLPKVLLNSSAFHNRHHANAEVNFGEAFTIWDRLCRTREQ